MKTSQLYILIANLFLLASFFKDRIAGLMMLFIGGLWLMSAVWLNFLENRIEFLDRMKKRLQFEMILNLLGDHPNRRSKKK
jgi:hypothetical protein